MLTKIGRTIESFLIFFLAYLYLVGRYILIIRFRFTTFSKINYKVKRYKINYIIYNSSINENL